MPRPKTHEERTQMVNRIIELVKEHGRSGVVYVPITGEYLPFSVSTLRG